MNEQRADDNDKRLAEVELETDNYLLGFLDSLYAGIIAFSFTIVYGTLVKQNQLIPVDMEKHLILFLMALVFIVADWTGSRALVKDYPYVSKNMFARARVFIDVLIGCLYFALVIFASVLSSLYVVGFCVVFLLGAIWTYIIRLEYREYSDYLEQIKKDPRLKFIKATHLLLTVIFAGAWCVVAGYEADSWTNTWAFAVVITAFWSIFTVYKILCWIRWPKSVGA